MIPVTSNELTSTPVATKTAVVIFAFFIFDFALSLPVNSYCLDTGVKCEKF